MFACRFDQFGHLQTRIVLRSLEQPDAIVVEHKDGHHVRGVRAERRSANKVHDDIAPAGLSNIACVVRQLSHGIAGNAAGCKGEGCFLCHAQWCWLVRAFVGQGPTVQTHAFAEAARAAGEQRIEQGIVRELLLRFWCGAKHFCCHGSLLCRYPFLGSRHNTSRLVASFHLTSVKHSISASSRDLEVQEHLRSLTRFDTRCTLESSVWISMSYVMLNSTT